MAVRIEVVPFLLGAVVVGVLTGGLMAAWGARAVTALNGGIATALILGGYFLYFFRDPERIPPEDVAAIVAGADGRIASVSNMPSAQFRELCVRSGLRLEALGSLGETDVTRISIFLSLFDVHVNRAPISGQATFLGYFPGRRFFTFQEKSSELNQHNSILIQGERTCCLFNQIVGPVCRRVVYWPPHDRPVAVHKGKRIGMMKFGSRLDMYFPANEVVVLAEVGQRVRAGETVVARIVDETQP